MVCAKLALLAVAASSLALAQPLVHGHHHKRDVKTVIVTAPTVYVDQYGNVINGPDATPAAVVNYSPPVEIRPTSTAAAPAASSAAASSSSSSSSSGIMGKSIVYSPYHNDGTCKNAQDVATDLNTVIGKNKAYKGIRLYGCDCNQVQTVLAAAKDLDVKVMLGIYDITKASVDANSIVSIVGSDWSHVHSIGVGNEEVNKAVLAGKDGGAAAGASVAAADAVRSIVRAAGFKGAVVTPEVFTRFSQYPALCGQDDFVAANMHPFFDGNVAADGAGTFYKNQVANVQSACNGKKVLVAETGWPTTGQANGVAVPSQANQNTVISQACDVLKDDIIVLGAFNDKWKANFAGSYSAETYWGVHGDSPTN